MSMVSVYRVEKDGHGPHINGGVDCCSFPHYTMSNQPLPEEDGIGNYEKEHNCGFANFEQFWDWFGPGLDELKRKGYTLLRFAVPSHHVKWGRKQIMFRRDRSTIVEEIPI